MESPQIWQLLEQFPFLKEAYIPIAGLKIKTLGTKARSQSNIYMKEGKDEDVFFLNHFPCKLFSLQNLLISFRY